MVIKQGKMAAKRMSDVLRANDMHDISQGRLPRHTASRTAADCDDSVASSSRSEKRSWYSDHLGRIGRTLGWAARFEHVPHEYRRAHAVERGATEMRFMKGPFGKG
jgi:hypothetical protein